MFSKRHSRSTLNHNRPKQGDNSLSTRDAGADEANKGEVNPRNNPELVKGDKIIRPCVCGLLNNQVDDDPLSTVTLNHFGL